MYLNSFTSRLYSLKDRVQFYFFQFHAPVESTCGIIIIIIIIRSSFTYKSSVERQKGLTTSHLHTQLDPFASVDACNR